MGGDVAICKKGIRSARFERVMNNVMGASLQQVVLAITDFRRIPKCQLSQILCHNISVNGEAARLWQNPMQTRHASGIA